MKFKIEIIPDCEEEIIIRCRAPSDKITRLQTMIASELSSQGEIRLTMGEKEYFVPLGDVLFFETDGERTAAHVAPDIMMYTSMRLLQLEKIVPHSFIRVSKSCILNSAEVASISRNLTGSSEVSFKNCNKKAYVSRMYYRDLIERIGETRLRPLGGNSAD